MFDYRELKTYSVVSKNYFWNNCDLEEFMNQVIFKYEVLIMSSGSLKLILRDLNRLERKILYEAETHFKEIVQDDFTYIDNFLNAIYRVYVNKLDARLFKIYKNKENKEYFYYDIYYKDTELKNINSLDVIQFFIENFKLDFGNLGSASLFINNQLKYCKSIRIERLYN